MRRFTTFAIAIAALLLGMGTFAFAQSETFLDGKVRTGDRITVGGDDVVDGDLYIFGGDVSVDGRITGDLVVFAGQVSVRGEVEGVVFAGAGTVDIDGDVGGDVRAGTGQLRVDGSVAYTEVDYCGPTALVLGSEAGGLSPVWCGDDVRAVRLPMLGTADSLNVSATAAVLFFEARRQRDSRSG
mgnify:CR=1 FL=1